MSQMIHTGLIWNDGVVVQASSRFSHYFLIELVCLTINLIKLYIVMLLLLPFRIWYQIPYIENWTVSLNGMFFVIGKLNGDCEQHQNVKQQYHIPFWLWRCKVAGHAECMTDDRWSQEYNQGSYAGRKSVITYTRLNELFYVIRFISHTEIGMQLDIHSLQNYKKVLLLVLQTGDTLLWSRACIVVV
jgi:hypothetical protein